MKVLITGATGLVGSEIVRVCHKQGIAVHYLTTRKNKIVSQVNYKGFFWKPDENKIDLKCFEGITAIINLAGAPISKRWTTTYKNKILSSRLNSLQTIYSALEKIDTSAITSFVSASGIGIYPNSLDAYYTEKENNVDKSFLGDVVKAWETQIKVFEKFSFNVSIIRIGLVMSSKGGALPEIAKPIQYYLGAAYGDGQQWQSWIYITDLARMFLFVIEKNLYGSFNGVGPNPVTNAKLVKIIAQVLNKPLFLPNIPKFFMKIILGEMSYLLFCSQRVSSKKIKEQGFVFQYTNISSALEGIYTQKISNGSASMIEG